MKLLLITNIPNPYRIPLFNLLDQTLRANNDELLVAFGTDRYSRRKFDLNLKECKFSYQILKSGRMPVKKSEGVLLTYTGIIRLLKEYKPDKIIVAGFSIATLKLFFISVLTKYRYIIWSGVIHSQGRKQPKFQLYLRKFLCKRAIGGVAYGTKSKEYLESLGITGSNIRIAINTVDTSFFRNETHRIRIKESTNALKKKLLSVGYLTQGKRIDILLQLVKVLSARRNDFILQIVGDGPEREKLKQLTKDLDIEDYVEFVGFIQKPELPIYLASAYTFLFPSEYDIWGLVLIEAMAAEIPCIASEKAGATSDLILDNENGYIVNFERIQSVSKMLTYLLDNRSERDRLGENASAFIREHVSLEASVKGFTEALYEL